MLKEYFSIAEILSLKLDGYTNDGRLFKQANEENWLYRSIRLANSDKPVREYHISNFPCDVRELIVSRLLERARKQGLHSSNNIAVIEESIRITYSRLEIILYIRSRKLGISNFSKQYNNRKFKHNELSATVYENIKAMSERSIYRWLKAYDTWGLEGLKYKVHERKYGKGILKTEEIELKDNEITNIKELIIGIFLEKPHLKVKVIYKFLKDLTKKHNVGLPSYRTVCRYLEEYKEGNKGEVLLAKNPDAWKNKYLLAIGSYSEEAVEVNYLWELDSSPADIMLEGGRYMILACIDVYSRRAKFLVNKTSNSMGITSLLRSCFLEWGIPKIIKTDNGKDYVSQQIKIVLSEFGIEHRLANPFQGQEKPHVERLFGRFQHDFVEALPNFLGHNVAERKALESIKTFEKRLFGREEVLYMKPTIFQKFCNWWIENEYMNVGHAGLNGSTPNSRLEGFTARLPQGEELHKLNLLLEPLAGLRTIVKKGIRVENRNYFKPELAKYVGEQVQIRVDRFDMGKIYVFNQKHEFICEAVNYELLGNDKFEFIRQGKAIQNAVVKQAKHKAKQLINKAKGKLDYLEPLKLDLQEAIDEVINPQVNKLQVNTMEAQRLKYEEEKSEKDRRYKEAKEYEERVANGEILNADDQEWLNYYQTTAEYKVREDFKDGQIIYEFEGVPDHLKHTLYN